MGITPGIILHFICIYIFFFFFNTVLDFSRAKGTLLHAFYFISLVSL